MKSKGYKTMPLSFNRKMVRASAAVTKYKSAAIHSMTEVDITIPRRLIQNHFQKTGEKFSFTAYVVACFAQVLKQYPHLNSFIRRNKLILLDDVCISVLIEREFDGELVPEPVGIHKAQEKTFQQISDEIREAQRNKGERLGTTSGIGWIRYIPGFLLKLFVRIADSNLKMAKKYGKTAVTAVGMFSKEPVWFIPHGTATVLVTVGSIMNRVVESEGAFVTREHLCLTISFDHNIVDGAPAARFMNQFTETLKCGKFLETEIT